MNWDDIFEYDDGKLRWKQSPRKHLIGQLAGGRDSTGNSVTTNYKKYQTRRIIWEMFNGEIPPGYFITSIDGDSFNDRIENLKIVQRGEIWKKTSDNFIGTHIKGKKYVSRIKINKHIIHLGTFNTREEAARAYDRALIRYGRFNSKSNFPLEDYR